jgi:hypothetical protein
MATILVVATGATAHHLYETHLSSGYAPILKATLQLSNIEERAQCMHEARVAGRALALHIRVGSVLGIFSFSARSRNVRG